MQLNKNIKWLNIIILIKIKCPRISIWSLDTLAQVQRYERGNIITLTFGICLLQGTSMPQISRLGPISKCWKTLPHTSQNWQNIVLYRKFDCFSEMAATFGVHVGHTSACLAVQRVRILMFFWWMVQVL